jgi:hypothetical protein
MFRPLFWAVIRSQELKNWEAMQCYTM